MMEQHGSQEFSIDKSNAVALPHVLPDTCFSPALALCSLVISFSFGHWTAELRMIYGGVIWGFPIIRGTLFGGPHNKDYSILGSILGSLYFGKLPYEFLLAVLLVITA